MLFRSVQLSVCGDGVLDPGEACDDGSNAPCDGCASDCKRLEGVCGDGTIECREACDDGNREDGDGCASDCSPPGGEAGRWVGSTIRHGCFAQWVLSAHPLRSNDKTGFPALDQECVDGDERCDHDGRNDMSCSFEARVCVRGDDPRLEECRATVAPQPGQLLCVLAMSKPHSGQKRESRSSGCRHERQTIGESAGLILRSPGGVGMPGGNCPSTAEMAVCTSWAAA